MSAKLLGGGLRAADALIAAINGAIAPGTYQSIVTRGVFAFDRDDSTIDTMDPDAPGGPAGPSLIQFLGVSTPANIALQSAKSGGTATAYPNAAIVADAFGGSYDAISNAWTGGGNLDAYQAVCDAWTPTQTMPIQTTGGGFTS